MNNKVGVYLAGSCKHVSIEERNTWRKYITDCLNKTDNLYAFNPNEHFSYETNMVEEKVIMDFFLHELKKCEVLVVNLNNSDKTTGTGIEFGMGLALDKFIIGFGNENVYQYMKDKCSIVFDDVDDVVDFLLEHFR